MHMTLLRFAQSLGGCSLALLSHWGDIPLALLSRWGMLPHFAQSLGGCSLASLSHFSFNGSIKLLQSLHSRGPTKQHFYVWEPHCGYLHITRKVHWYPLIKEGQRFHKNVNCAGTPMLTKLLHHIEKWSRTSSLKRANGIINMHS